MILIDVQTRGRFGNKVFHYNTLVQFSNIVKQNFLCADWDASSFFKGVRTEGSKIETPAREIPPFDLINLTENELIERYSSGDFKLSSLSLCGPYFRLTKKDPREFLEFEHEPQLAPDGKVIVGIHIRGGDFRGGDGNEGREIHSPEYYINAIKFVMEEYHDKELLFCVCTDDPDPNFPSYHETLKFLQENKLPTYIDIDNGYLKDFTILSFSDVLIAGSSTFVLAAGMLGKKKKIIHSKDFVEKFKDEDQKWYSKFGNGMFFHDLNHVKNDYYNLWKLI